MTFFAFGINFETAPVDVRGAFALKEESLRTIYRRAAVSGSTEFVILSTCNRTEAYLFGSEADVDTVKTVLTEEVGQAWPEANAFQYRDENAVRHLLHVTAGLRSMVPGDAQILAQVKEAYRIAVEEDRVGTVLHRLIHSSFRAAKRVASETELSSGAASISSAAVAMARTCFEAEGRPGLEGCRALLVGTGQMGRLALQALNRYDLAALAVTNRSRERAQMAAEVAGAHVVEWDALHEAVAGFDVVIVATGAEEPVLWADRLPRKSEHDRKTLIIDIAVPRNVQSAVGEIPGYTVLELDAIQAWTQHVERTRRAEIPRAEEICEETLAEFVSWMFHQQALQPAIQAIRDTFDHIRLQEIERHQHRFSSADYETLDRLTRSIMQKLLAVPIVRLKSTDPESIDFVRGVKLLQHLFSRPGCEEAPHPAPALSEQAPCGMTRAVCPLSGGSHALQAIEPKQAALFIAQHGSEKEGAQA